MSRPTEMENRRPHEAVESEGTPQQSSGQTHGNHRINVNASDVTSPAVGSGDNWSHAVDESNLSVDTRHNPGQTAVDGFVTDNEEQL